MARVCIGSSSSSENCGVLLLNGLEKKKKEKTVLWLKTLSPFHCIFDQWFLYAVVLPDKLGWLHFTTILKYIKKIYITKIKKKIKILFLDSYLQRIKNRGTKTRTLLFGCFDIWSCNILLVYFKNVFSDYFRWWYRWHTSVCKLFHIGRIIICTFYVLIDTGLDRWFCDFCEVLASFVSSPSPQCIFLHIRTKLRNISR